jgi:hypothetical protein
LKTSSLFPSTIEISVSKHVQQQVAFGRQHDVIARLPSIAMVKEGGGWGLGGGSSLDNLGEGRGCMTIARERVAWQGVVDDELRQGGCGGGGLVGQG